MRVKRHVINFSAPVVCHRTTENLVRVIAAYVTVIADTVWEYPSTFCSVVLMCLEIRHFSANWVSWRVPRGKTRFTNCFVEYWANNLWADKFYASLIFLQTWGSGNLNYRVELGTGMSMVTGWMFHKLCWTWLEESVVLMKIFGA